MIKPMIEWNREIRKVASRNFTTLHAIQCNMKEKMFKFIASLESAKYGWYTLQAIFEGSRCKDPKKEKNDINLKRAQSESNVDQEDQDRINRHKAYSSIAIIKEVIQ